MRIYGAGYNRTWVTTTEIDPRRSTRVRNSEIDTSTCTIGPSKGMGQ